MAKGTGDIIHAVATRIRVVGSGNLQLYLRSLDNVRNVQLANITMASTTNKEPITLANFKEQRIQLELKTTLIDETFTISKIVIFVKPVAEGYPVGV